MAILDLTTTARVKTLIGETGATQDALLGLMVTAVSAEMEQEMRRGVKEEARTETFSLHPDIHVLGLSASPVLTSPAPVIKASNTRDFASSTALVLNQDAVVEYEIGVLRFLYNMPGTRIGLSGHVIQPAFVQVTYTGGLASSTANLITAYPQLAMACDLQVAYMHRRRTNPGGDTIVGPSSTSYQGAYDWLPQVKRILSFYRRRTVA